MIFASAVPFEVGTLVKQIREAGITLPIVGGDGYDTPSLLELAGASVRSTSTSRHTKASMATIA